MRELAINEIEMVGGAALSPDTGVNLIGAIGGVAFLVAAPAAGAFALGIALGYYGGKAINEILT
jgi:hypothetical protein